MTFTVGQPVVLNDAGKLAMPSVKAPYEGVVVKIGNLHWPMKDAQSYVLTVQLQGRKTPTVANAAFFSPI